MRAVVVSYLTREKGLIKLGSLFNHYKRKEMIDFFNEAIDRFLDQDAMVTTHPALECVECLLEIHRKGSIQCHLHKGKHYILYVALKISFDWRVEAALVAEVLRGIFRCEGSFDNVMSGAITGLAKTITGWRPDQNDIVENLEAVEFFINASTKERCLFRTKHGLLRIQEVPLINFDKNKTPLMVAMEMNAFPFIILLIRYGAKLNFNQDLLMKHPLKINDKLKKYLARCGYNQQKILQPMSLKFLSKLVVRQALFKAWNLPDGISKLNLPKILERYIDLEFD